MGTRIIYRVQDSERQLVATLYSNSSHTTQFAEEVFDAVLATPAAQDGPNGLVEGLLTARYATAEGNHRAGDRIFWLVPAEEAIDGDREAVITAVNLSNAYRNTGITVGNWTVCRASA